MNRDDLCSHLDCYLALKADLGQERRRLERNLRAFVDYLGSHLTDGEISTSLVLDWVCSTQCGPAGQRLRLSRARGFLHYLRVSLPETQAPDFNLLLDQLVRLHISIPMKRSLRLSKLPSYWVPTVRFDHTLMPR